MGIGKHILDAIGNTPLVELRRIVPNGSARIETSRQLSQQSGHFWADQFNDADVLTGYAALGNEIWSQTDGHIDAYVQGVGPDGADPADSGR